MNWLSEEAIVSPAVAAIKAGHANRLAANPPGNSL
jgi:hypothetical protein